MRLSRYEKETIILLNAAAVSYTHLDVYKRQAYGHSVIRGLVTYRLMVRRELCYLKAWITVLRAHIGRSQITRTLKMCIRDSYGRALQRSAA